MMLEEAIRIAVSAHKGQMDKAGAPYILHPLRVMAAVDTPEEMAVAVLHDVIEDTGTTLDDLRRAGIPEDVCEAVRILTKAKGEDYSAYLDRVASNPLARAVKIADLRDNMRIERLPVLADEDFKRLAKYHSALKRLTGEPDRSATAPEGG
jgi:(p)ppGpp synthase/HD superfamily hydrolase